MMLIGWLQNSILSLWLTVTQAGFTPASLQDLASPHAHELAHVRRNDYAVNLLQTLLETLFFYHPAIWWLSRRIRIEREHCCDDLVIATLNNRSEYGRALIAVEQLRSQPPSLAIGVNDGTLLARIRRIARVAARSDQQGTSRLPIALLALAGLCLSVVVMLSLQANADENDGNETSAFIAEVADDIEVELVAVGYHPSAEKVWWKPNGDPLSQPPDLPDSGFSVGSNEEAKSRSREFLLKIRGLPQDHRVRTKYKPPSASGSSYLNGLWIGYHGAGPFDTTTTSIWVGISTAPYGPWMTFDTDGVKSEKIEVPTPLRSIYDNVIVKDIESDEITTSLLVDNDPYNRLYDLADFELYAVDKASKQHRRSSESVPANGGPRELTFKLPITEIVRFEYRVRPYTKWVIFDNVSLQPGQQTDVTISTETKDDARDSTDATPALSEFGPESHGLRCRLIALPVDVNEDDPSFQQTVFEFARSSNMTFGVELKNFSDEPMVLAGVRYSDGYAEEVRGKLRTEMLAPHWFDFDFVDLNGKAIARPWREFFDGWIVANGASTHELSPGQSLKIALKPAKFMEPFDHELLPGKYAVKVRYRGPGETLRDRVREHWPDKPILDAWKYEVASKPIEFSITGSTDPSAETDLVWGPVQQGLQAAIGYQLFEDNVGNPSNVPSVPVGTSVGVRFHVRNASDEVITFISETGRQGDAVLVTDSQGNNIDVRETFFTGEPIDVEWRLQPGEVAELAVLAPAVNSIREPGHYNVRYTIRFNSRVQKDDAGNVIFPRPGDYDAELETGVTPLYLHDASDASNDDIYQDSAASTTDNDARKQGASAGSESKKFQLVEGETSTPLEGIECIANIFKQGTPTKIVARTTDKEGIIEVQVPEDGGAWITDVPSGWFTSAPSVIAIELDENGITKHEQNAVNNIGPTIVKLWRGTEVDGRLLWPNKTPAEGVKLSAGVYINSQSWKKNLGMDLAFYSFDHGDWPNWSRTIITDDAGRFRVTVPPPQARLWFRIGTTSLGFSPQISQGEDESVTRRLSKCVPLEIQYGGIGQSGVINFEDDSDGDQFLRTGDLQLQTGVIVRGRVVNAEGKGLSDVNLTTTGPHGPHSGRSTISGDDGEFEFPAMVAGRMTVHVDSRLRDVSKPAHQQIVSREVQAVFADQSFTIAENGSSHEITVRSIPHTEITFQWVDRRKDKTQPIAYYGTFRLRGYIPDENGDPSTYWTGETQLVDRGGEHLLTIKVPSQLLKPELMLPADRRVTASYSDSSGVTSGPGIVPLGDIAADTTRTIFGDLPRAKRNKND
ncbi:M56 family metallopeptidase [Novipirellula rosea]|uniref:Peptidase M56 domain-containing protein n=1 Tax=Novipirellula rosea TaxID=1031540 RepID=A0ABP8MPY1_9BACT